MIEVEQQAAPRIMLVEDDLRLAALTQEFLVSHGFDVAHVARGDVAVDRIPAEMPQLVLLDVLLPGLSGMEVCRVVRDRYAGAILMLTACDEDIDQIQGLNLGADDYLVKPVDPQILLARIRALLRRGAVRAQATTPVLQFGGLKISPEARSVLLDGLLVELTATEFDLLWLLASHAGKAMSRDKLIAQLRNIHYDGTNRSVDIAISRLRRKLHDAADSPRRIKTLRGRGYLFVADAW